jgi:hypothetical protein
VPHWRPNSCLTVRQALTRKAIEIALDGDTVALRLCLERFYPPRKDRSLSFALKRPGFVYAGANSRLPKLPGAALPARLRQPILVQLRDTRTDGHDVHFDRFQLIDSDFA